MYRAIDPDKFHPFKSVSILYNTREEAQEYIDLSGHHYPSFELKPVFRAKLDRWIVVARPIKGTEIYRNAKIRFEAAR